MQNFLNLCWLFVFLSLVALNESKSFVQPFLSKPKVTKNGKESKVVQISKLSSGCAEKVLSLRGGKLADLDWRYFVAGGVCAAFSHGITTPLDVVKTKMQTDPQRFNKGALHAAGDIIKKEGVSFLLAGLGPTVVGYGFEGALKFGCYETFKKIFDAAKITPFQFTNFVLASGVAGAVASIVLCPMEEARIKMVEDPSWSKENVVTAIIRLIRENGIFATFAGLPAMFAKQVPYTMGKNVSFDFMKSFFASLVAYFALGKEADLKYFISTGAAFLTAIVACLLSQPGDMILTSSYKGESGKSFFQTIQEIYRSHGLAGFYVGTQARLAHVSSIITTQLVFYDIINAWLGVPSHH